MRWRSVFPMPVVHVQIEIESLSNGHQRARCTRLPKPPAGNYKCSMQTFSVYRYADEAFRGWQPVTDQFSFITLHLWWSKDIYTETLEEKIVYKLQKYVKGLLKTDHNLRDYIYDQIKGTGWYFAGDLIR